MTAKSTSDKFKMMTRRSLTSCFFIPCFVLMIGILSPARAYASLEKDIARLKPHKFCINADFDHAWEATANVLRRMSIEPSLADPSFGMIATIFIQADYQRMLKISSDPRVFTPGRFTIKIHLKQESPAFTLMEITLQIRQTKLIGKEERLVPSRGMFEKYLAHLINQQALLAQFPGLRDLRLGMSLIPDLSTEQYYVDNIEPNSPAGEAGFHKGDRLLAINQHKISIRGELFDEIIPSGPTLLAEFKILRGRKKKMIPVWMIRVKKEQTDWGAVIVRDKKTRRLLIKDVAPSSKASQARVFPGDIISSIQTTPIENFTDYYRALAHYADTGPMQMTVVRGAEEVQAKFPA